MTLDDGMDPGNVLFGCPYFIVRYRDRVRLDKHMEERHPSHGEELKCIYSDCNAAFDRHYDLVQYIKSHIE